MEVVDLIGMEDARQIKKIIRELSNRNPGPFEGPPMDFSGFLAETTEVLIESSGELVQIALEAGVSYDPQSGRIN